MADLNELNEKVEQIKADIREQLEKIENTKGVYEYKKTILDKNGIIGGLMKHVYGMTAITNPLVNSYKRLVSGFEAPLHITWSVRNRSPLIRIPSAVGGGTRIELRSPDCAANPYLTIALCLAAGLDGMKNKITPPENIQKNMFSMSEEEKAERNIKSLPTNLSDAVEALEQDAFIQDVLGDHISNVYINSKKDEWERYCRAVTQWEVDEYLDKF